jgi:hypothetical protein
MKPRSPVLGYNHNVRYAGRLWHVQTEDSGVQNPHIFTHLFSDGTILATKRLDYDPSSEVAVVQKLMQAQHKAMLRDLKQGAFDDKIERYFGVPVVKERDDATDPGRPASGEFDAEPKTDPSIPELPAAGSSSSKVPKQPPQPVAVSARGSSTSVPVPPSARTASTTSAPRPNLTPSRPAIPVAASRTGSPAAQQPQRAPVTGIGGRRPQGGVAHPYGGGKPTAEGVVVARPAVIVGDQNTAPRNVSAPRQRSFTPPPTNAGATAAPPQPSKTPTSDNIFGGDLISEKSLDEVILAYLSEDMNEK